MGASHASLLYDIYKDPKLERITWPKFIELIAQLKTQDKFQKLQLFKILADRDGNGALSYEEINFLAKDSIISMLGNNQHIYYDDEFFEDLCDHYTRQIFQICQVETNQEI